MPANQSYSLDCASVAIVDALPDVGFVLDPAGLVAAANRPARQLLGIGDGDADPLSVAAVAERLTFSSTTGVPFAGAAHPLLRAVRGETLRQVDAVVRSRTGGSIDVSIDANPIVTAEGQTAGVLVMLRDVTACQRRQQTREEFLSLATHELRTPLQAILGFACILERLRPDDRGTERERRAIQNVKQGAQQMIRLINDLLEASRVETHRLVLEPQSIDLPGLVYAVVERLGEILAAHSVEIAIRCPIPPIDADPGRVEQVLVNLLTNAARYSGAGAPIRVEVDVAEGDPSAAADRVGAAVITVADEGVGIDPADVPHLFEGFYRGNVGRQSTGDGLGLGLYVCRGIVEAHGGQIWVESRRGEGATFRFTLPIGRRVME